MTQEKKKIIRYLLIAFVVLLACFAANRLWGGDGDPFGENDRSGAAESQSSLLKGEPGENAKETTGSATAAQSAEGTEQEGTVQADAEMTSTKGDAATGCEEGTDDHSSSKEGDVKAAERDEETQKLCVHVSGEVIRKDVLVTLPAGARLADAVKAAGGLTKEADLTDVNLARRLLDGQKIYIPRIGEEKREQWEEGVLLNTGTDPAGESGENGNSGHDVYGGDTRGTGSDQKSGNTGAEKIAGNAENGLTNINFATKIELESLPGIGSVIAERIIEYREKAGSFSSIEDIMHVSGIGEKLFEKLKDRITV